MDLSDVLLIWVASVAVGTIWAAMSRRTVWWIGSVTTVLFGPLGLILVAVDIATA